MHLANVRAANTTLTVEDLTDCTEDMELRLEPPLLVFILSLAFSSYRTYHVLISRVHIPSKRRLWHLQYSRCCDHYPRDLFISTMLIHPMKKSTIVQTAKCRKVALPTGRRKVWISKARLESWKQASACEARQFSFRQFRRNKWVEDHITFHKSQRQYRKPSRRRRG